MLGINDGYRYEFVSDARHAFARRLLFSRVELPSRDTFLGRKTDRDWCSAPKFVWDPHAPSRVHCDCVPAAGFWRLEDKHKPDLKEWNQDVAALAAAVYAVDIPNARDSFAGFGLGDDEDFANALLPVHYDKIKADCTEAARGKNPRQLPAYLHPNNDN